MYWSLVAAARSMGAGRARLFRTVVLPLSAPGTLAALALTFVIALGFYITPSLTGGPRDQMVSFYIAAFVKESLNWGMASALSVLLLGAVLVIVAIYGAARWAMARPGGRA